MDTLKQFCLKIFRVAKQAFYLPRTMVNVFKEKQRWLAQKDVEAERLDRIRNPSKYLGK
jgi:hypothetical protein